MLRFDRFELVPETRELFRDGAPVSLEPQPAALLVLLVTRGRTRLARRDSQRLWGADTHVNYQEGLHYCVRRVRLALGDVARDSRYIETIPRRGYRFRAGLIKADQLRRAASPDKKGIGRGRPSPGWLRLGLVEQRPNRHHDIAVTWVSWAMT